MKRAVAMFEQMESRMLMSVATPMDVAPGDDGMVATTAVHAATTTGHSPFSGSFTINGSSTKSPANPDTGAKFQLHGSGTAKGLGTLTLGGSVQLPGFIATAKATGRLTLTNTHGTITLSVAGPSQHASGSLPTSLNYSIVSGTGPYAKSKGTGKITVVLSSTTNKFKMIFNPAK